MIHGCRNETIITFCALIDECVWEKVSLGPVEESNHNCYFSTFLGGLVVKSACLFIFQGLPPIVDWYLHGVERQGQTDSFQKILSPRSRAENLCCALKRVGFVSIKTTIRLFGSRIV